jgi:hypothetical protein
MQLRDVRTGEEIKMQLRDVPVGEEIVFSKNRSLKKLQTISSALAQGCARRQSRRVSAKRESMCTVHHSL